MFSALALAGCGGGGDGGSVAAPAPSAAAPESAPSAPSDGAAFTGSVSAPFAAGANPAYAFVGAGMNSSGALSNFTQAASGAATSVGRYTLGAPTTVRDISGDATFAMGRWVAGTVTDGSSSQALSESGNVADHYVLFNRPASLPASGTLACDAGTFTTPTYVAGTRPANEADTAGHTTGTAQLSFSASGADIQLTLAVNTGASTGSNSFAALLPPSTGLVFSGKGLGGSQPYAWVGLGANGSAYDVVGSYNAATNNGSVYAGVFRFHCQ